MNRRTFLAATPTAAVALASLKAPLFVPVDIFVEMPPGCLYELDYRACDMCYEKAYHDFWENKPARQFFVTTDKYNLCVCEHCIGDYLSEEA